MKNLLIISALLGIIGVFIFGPDGFPFLGLSSFFLGFIILKFYENKCSKCGKWFSYKKIDENFSNFVNENIFSDKVHAIQNITYECKNCKNKKKSIRRVTKVLKGNSNYEIDRILRKK